MLRFKVDENQPAECVDMLRQSGHEAMSVVAQGLGGRDDASIHAICREEGRAILTLDRGLGDPRRHPPTGGPGIVVLRPSSQDRACVLTMVHRFIASLPQHSLQGSLWVVEPHGIRIRR